MENVFPTNTSSSFDNLVSSIPGVGDVIDGAKAIVSSIEKVFGIGAGRREADAIVPYQNELIALLDYDALNAARSGAEVYAMKVSVQQAAAAFYKFLGVRNGVANATGEWPDGRAATQAYRDVKPYVDGFILACDRRIGELGGVTYAAAGYAANQAAGFAFNNSTALIIGGAVVLALFVIARK